MLLFDSPLSSSGSSSSGSSSSGSSSSGSSSSGLVVSSPPSLSPLSPHCLPDLDLVFLQQGLSQQSLHRRRLRHYYHWNLADLDLLLQDSYRL